MSTRARAQLQKSGASLARTAVRQTPLLQSIAPVTERVNLFSAPTGTGAGHSFSRVSVLPSGRAEGEGEEQDQPAQAQAGSAPAPALTDIAFSTGTRGVHVPLMGITAVAATPVPANATGLAWTLAAGTAQVAAGTQVTAQGAITFGAAQSGGTIRVTATQTLPDGSTFTAWQDLGLHFHPTGINATSEVGSAPGGASVYGALFDHDFTSADGNITSLENVAVGEQFPALPDPNGTSHTFPTPFGSLTLSTKNLAATPANGSNWFLTGGALGGTHDSVTMDRSMVNIGDLITSASKPVPANTLPASFSVTQSLNWFCWQTSQWNAITDVPHERTLRDAGGSPEFAVTVNGTEHTDTYTGHPAIFHARATPATIPTTTNRRSPSRTTIAADTLPSTLPAGHALRFSIVGPPLGCSINATSGVLTAGNQAGSVRVRVRDSVAANPNFDEVTVQIATPAPAPTPAPTPPTGGTSAATPNATTPEPEATAETTPES